MLYCQLCRRSLNQGFVTRLPQISIRVMAHVLIHLFALNSQVSEEVTAALKRVRESGRKLILVTGRELDHLQEIYSHLELFDRGL